MRRSKVIWLAVFALLLLTGAAHAQGAEPADAKPTTADAGATDAKKDEAKPADAKDADKADATTTPATGTPAPTAATITPAEHGSLATCLREHGVSETGGSVVLGPPAGVDPATWDKAMKACSTLAPGPGPGN